MASNLVNKIIDSEGSINWKTEQGCVYTYLNPVSYLIARKHIPLFSQMDGIFADGGLLVKAINLLYGKKVTRRSFDMTSMAPDLFAFADEHKNSVCIVASKDAQLQKAIAIFSNQYPNIVWKGCRNGYFSSQEEKEQTIKDIIQLYPDYLIVGMGVVAQEEFLLQAKQMGFKGIGFTCGGFIHQTAENDIHYYPDWIDKFNLRFLYRMYKEKHTRKRYIKAGFVFPWLFLKDRFL